MLNSALIIFGKSLAKFSQMFNLGGGSTWPGHIALTLNKNFIREILKGSKIKTVLIAGTNGKTTTGKMIQTILEKNGQKVFQNESGANLLNGIASSMLLRSNILCTLKYDYAIFEVDENTLPQTIDEFTPDYVVLLNLFRDQLDRYGEVDTIAKKWRKSLASLSKSTILILNADDPLIAFLGKDIKNKTYYFGIDPTTKTKIQTGFGIELTNRVWKGETADSIYCPNCNSKLTYNIVYFSHLGDWSCPSCKFARPRLDLSNVNMSPLVGTHNRYNTNAAVLFAKINNISSETIKQSLKQFTPAFGRQETIVIDRKKVRIFLSKNPTSFNESLKTVVELGGKNLLFVLNDRIPDGRDISWIWDTDIESVINDFKAITVSGDRCYDMGLRLKYAFNELQITNYKLQIEENLKNAISFALADIKKSETLYILPTYSAMLEVRKILTGHKIL